MLTKNILHKNSSFFNFFCNSNSYLFSAKKQAYLKGKQPTNLINVSLGETFTLTTEKYPDLVAINSYSQNVTMTYEQVFKKSLELATALIKKLHLKPKDRIGIYSYNKWEWYIIQMAAGLADLILVNINPAYQSEELAFTLQKVGLKVLFMSDQFKNSDYLGIIKKILPQIQTTQSPYDITSSRFPFLKSVVRFNQGQQTQKGFINFSDLFIDGDRKCLPKYPSCYDPTNIQFTSGTTGLPKAATLSHYNILNNGYQIGNRTKYTHKDNILLSVPFYHCFGMVMGSLAALTRGAGITLVSEGFDPKKCLQAADKYKCTSLYGVPTMFIEYLRVFQQNPSAYNLSNLRTGIVAGSLCPQSLMNKIMDKLKLVDITNCYGMTQTSPVSFQTSPQDSFIKKTTTVGTVLDGLQAKIIDENGKICSVGESGQFCTKGWHVMIQYWNDKSATQKSIIDGWMNSGDMGVIDQDGFLSIVGRKKDMIIRGGENVYPKQIQEFLLKMEGLIDVQVIGVSDTKFGQQIAALIKVKDLNHNKITRHQVLHFCKGNIAHYKIPKYVKFVTQLPLTVTGKPQKFVMRKQFQQQLKSGKAKQYEIRK